MARILLGVVAAVSTFQAAPAQASYREWAEEASAFVQRTFWDERAGLYRPASPPEPRDLPYDFMWGSGVQLSHLAAAARYEPERYRAVLRTFFRGLDRYWDAAAPIPGYDAYFSSPTSDDKYYDDNAWVVLALVEAYETTGESAYLERAEATLRFVLSGWDERLGGGIYWRQDRKSKNTCSNGPSAAAALAVARHRKRQEYVAWARRIVEWTSDTLQGPEGIFWDNWSLAGRVERTKWTYNTALMLRSNLWLYRATREKPYLAEAERQAAASVKEFVNPATGAFRDDARFSHLLVEALLDLYRETRDPILLAQVRRNVEFLHAHVRDTVDGGYWSAWKILPDRREPRKLLISNAAAARMLWVAADYSPRDQSGRRTR